MAEFFHVKPSSKSEKSSLRTGASRGCKRTHSELVLLEWDLWGLEVWHWRGSLGRPLQGREFGPKHQR